MSAAEEVIEYLNVKTSKRYKKNSVKTKILDMKIKENNYCTETIKKMIDKKCEQWLNTEYAKYLRPETLFGPKMDMYLEELLWEEPQKVKIEEETELLTVIMKLRDGNVFEREIEGVKSTEIFKIKNDKFYSINDLLINTDDICIIEINSDLNNFSFFKPSKLFEQLLNGE